MEGRQIHDPAGFAEPESPERIEADLADMKRFQELIADFGPSRLRLLPEILEIDRRFQARRLQETAAGTVEPTADH